MKFWSTATVCLTLLNITTISTYLAGEIESCPGHHHRQQPCSLCHRWGWEEPTVSCSSTTQSAVCPYWPGIRPHPQPPLHLRFRPKLGGSGKKEHSIPLEQLQQINTHMILYEVIKYKLFIFAHFQISPIPLPQKKKKKSSKLSAICHKRLYQQHSW